MSARKLTDRWVAAMAVGEKLEDTECYKLFVYRHRTKATYYLQRRVNGKLIRPVCGHYVGPGSTQLARSTGFTLSQQIQVGRNPIEERRRARKRRGHTYALALEDYRLHLADHPRQREYLRTCSQALPEWGDRVLATLTPDDAADLAVKLRDERSVSISRGVCGQVSAFISWCISQRRFEIRENPFHHLRLGKLVGVIAPRSRTLSDEELRLVWAAAGQLAPHKQGVIKLLLLLGLRRGELAGLQWSEVDESQALITLPGSRTKNSEAHVAPLPPLALQILATLPGEGDYVFGGHRPLAGFSYIKGELDRLLPTNMPPWVIHDLRRTFRSGLARLGVNDTVAELCIGHKQRGIVAVYNHYSYLNERRAALELWSAELKKIVG